MSKILIIEDEEAIADLEKDYLELSGFDVEIATRGDVGLEKALKEEYDLIILDLMLPEVDGFDICRQVREEKNIPIIMVSAKKDDIDKIRGLGLGADDYMTKPFSPSELVVRLKNLDVSYIYQLGKLFGDLFQNHGISTAYNCHSGITLICSHTNCQAVNIITATAEKSGNTAQNTCGVIY